MSFIPYGRACVVVAIVTFIAAAACDRRAVPARETAAALDTPTPTVQLPDSISAIRVNTGPAGMAARVRWMLSPDEDAILAVEDPAGVEAEALPNGIVFASERRGVMLQIDGVWDAMPSPDWSRLAIGRAFILRGAEHDSIPTAEWTRLEGWLPQDVAAPSMGELRTMLRPHLFPASGMAYMFGIGLAQIVDLERYEPGRVAVVEAPTVALDGWRVRWSSRGDTLAAGAAPTMVQDDANASRWSLVPARPTHYASVKPRVTTDSSRLVTPRWIEGPTLDISIPIDLREAKTIRTNAGASVESRDGLIRLVSREGASRTIGPGVPLAATASGRFILALRAAAGGSGERNAELVVYAGGM
jgi:hypothetical protein